MFLLSLEMASESNKLQIDQASVKLEKIKFNVLIKLSDFNS